ncbi:unnamed protein product, partial [Symbiodinium sp. KB8]
SREVGAAAVEIQPGSSRNRAEGACWRSANQSPLGRLLLWQGTAGGHWRIPGLLGRCFDLGGGAGRVCLGSGAGSLRGWRLPAGQGCGVVSCRPLCFVRRRGGLCQVPPGPGE